MDILVVGSGGREHAIIRKLKESPKAGIIYCAPGNGGISKDAECIPVSAMDIPAMVALAKEKKVGRSPPFSRLKLPFADSFDPNPFREMFQHLSDIKCDKIRTLVTI